MSHETACDYYLGQLERLLRAQHGEIAALVIEPLIQAAAGVEDDEMFRVFNMGFGIAIVVGTASADRVLQALHGAGAPDAQIIGSVTANQPGKLTIPARGLTGTRKGGFVRSG